MGCTKLQQCYQLQAFKLLTKFSWDLLAGQAPTFVCPKSCHLAMRIGTSPLFAMEMQAEHINHDINLVHCSWKIRHIYIRLGLSRLKRVIIRLSRSCNVTVLFFRWCALTGTVFDRHMTEKSQTMESLWVSSKLHLGMEVRFRLTYFDGS